MTSVGGAEINQSKNMTCLDNIRCCYCFHKERIEDSQSLKRGDHICMFGRKSTIKCCGLELPLYYHHCIVTDVTDNDPNNNKTCLVERIEFVQGISDKKITIQKVKGEIDFSKTGVFVIRYHHSTFPREQIVANAEEELKNGGVYSLVYNNCEHLCTRCCVGVKESVQVINILQFLFIFVVFCRSFLIYLQWEDKVAAGHFLVGGSRMFMLLWRKRNKSMCYSYFTKKTWSIWLFVLFSYSEYTVVREIQNNLNTVWQKWLHVLDCEFIIFLYTKLMNKVIGYLPLFMTDRYENVITLHVLKQADAVSVSTGIYGLTRTEYSMILSVSTEPSGVEGKITVMQFHNEKSIVEETIDINLRNVCLRRYSLEEIEACSEEIALLRVMNSLKEKKYKTFKSKLLCLFATWNAFAMFIYCTSAWVKQYTA